MEKLEVDLDSHFDMTTFFIQEQDLRVELLNLISSVTLTLMEDNVCWINDLSDQFHVHSA